MSVTYSTTASLPANATTLAITNINIPTGEVVRFRLTIYNPVDAQSGPILLPYNYYDDSPTTYVFPFIYTQNTSNSNKIDAYPVLQRNIGKYAWIEYTTDAGTSWQGIGDPLSTISGSIPAQNTATFVIAANKTDIGFSTQQALSPSATSIPLSNFTGYTGNLYFTATVYIAGLAYPVPYSYNTATSINSSSTLSLPLSNFYGVADDEPYRVNFIGDSNAKLSSPFQDQSGTNGWIEYSTDGLNFYGLGTAPYAAPTPWQFSSIPAGNTSTFLITSAPEPPPCFLEGSLILCMVNGVETYIPVEQLRKGTLVKTLYGVKPLAYIGTSPMKNPGTTERISERLYKLSPSAYPELTQDLFLTGAHAILVNKITDTQREALIKEMKRIFVTDKKYRLAACVDERAEPWASEGTYTIYHFALEHENRDMNYGVYANGLLVESCCISFLVEQSNMKLL